MEEANEIQILKRVMKDPYNFIRNYYEGVYMHMGKEVFSILSLVIPSLILPPIPHETAREIKPSINFLLIAPPGTAKSSMCETFEKLAYNSFPFEYITDAKLYDVVKQTDFVSLVVSDVFKVFSDKGLSKTMENVLGDEQKLSRFTMRTDSHEKKIRAVAFLAGTPNSLTSVISDGMIFRTALCLIIHNPEEHDKIGKFVSDGAFKEPKYSVEEKAIKYLYEELFKIQLGQHTKIKKIIGYKVNPEFKKRIFDVWSPLVKPQTKKTNFSFFRELHQGYRYMCAHAFLNIFNREIEDGNLVIDEKDVEVAIGLMEKELQTKFKILSCSNVVSEQKLKTTKDLAEYVEKVKQAKVKVDDSNFKEAIAIMGSLIKPS